MTAQDDFYAEDETPEECARSLAAAKTVLVIPSGLRRRLRRLFSALCGNGSR